MCQRDWATGPDSPKAMPPQQWGGFFYGIIHCGQKQEVRMWKEITAKQYNDTLEVLPPALWLSFGFLMGEPANHRKCKVSGNVMPTYTPFVYAFGRFYEGSPMTAAEFKQFNVNDLPPPK